MTLAFPMAGFSFATQILIGNRTFAMTLGIRFACGLLCAALAVSASSGEPPSLAESVATRDLVAHDLTLSDGRHFSLNLASGFDISIAAQGFKRARFLAQAPDGRFFLSELYNLADTRRGRVLVLDRFDRRRGTFGSVAVWQDGLRNPHGLGLYRGAAGTTWFYVATTDRLWRYRYSAGELSPSSAAEHVASFPDHGQSHRLGGWHATRSLAIGRNEKLYVTVGSSCNACEERERDRAVLLEMNLDGSESRVFAAGLRNAVGIRRVQEQLFVTHMGVDHLGTTRPDEALHRIIEGRHYGWPYCFESRSEMLADPQFDQSQSRIPCATVAPAYLTFAAHASPLGFDYFDSRHHDPRLRNHFLVALHGSLNWSVNTGHRVVSVKQGAPPIDFITGFKSESAVYGRPCDILSIGRDAFLLTDDHAGVVYYIRRQASLSGISE